MLVKCVNSDMAAWIEEKRSVSESMVSHIRLSISPSVQIILWPLGNVSVGEFKDVALTGDQTDVHYMKNY